LRNPPVATIGKVQVNRQGTDSGMFSGRPVPGLRVEQSEEIKKAPYIPGLNAGALRLGRISTLPGSRKYENQIKEIIS